MSSFYLVSFLLGSIYFINNSHILIFSIFRMCSADFIFYCYERRFNDRSLSSKKSEISTDPSTFVLWGLYSLLHDFSGVYTVDASVRSFSLEWIYLINSKQFYNTVKTVCYRAVLVCFFLFIETIYINGIKGRGGKHFVQTILSCTVGVPTMHKRLWI